MVLFSCKKDDFNPPFNNIKFYEDHEAANWTKETATEHLQGRWKLIHIFCCGFGESNNWADVEDEYFELQFEGDSVKVFKNNIHEQTQHWTFDKKYDEKFYLKTEEFISNTSGTIYFSEDYMLCNSSYMDGADYYYQKID